MRRLLQPAFERCVTFTGHLAFECRLPFAGGELLFPIEIANGMNRPLQAVPVARLEPVIIQFAFRLGGALAGPFEFAFGALQRHATHQSTGGLMQLALGDGPVAEMTALLLAQAPLQPCAAFPLLFRHP